MRVLTKATLKALILKMQTAVETEDQGLADEIITEYNNMSDEENFIIIHNMCATEGDTVNKIYFDFARMVSERSIYRRSIAYGEKVIGEATESKRFVQKRCADTIPDNNDFVQYLLEINSEIEGTISEKSIEKIIEKSVD